LWPNGLATIPRISSEYGMRFHPIDKVWRLHGGIDEVGYAIVHSPVDGEVIYTAYNGGFGNLVKVREWATGDEHWLAHNARFLVGRGAHVSAGQQVAVMGTTGASTGVHCHHEVHPARGGTINPRDYYAGRPAGGGSKPFEPKPEPEPTPEIEDDDMPKNTGLYYEVSDASGAKGTVVLIVNTESGWYHEYGNGIGKPAIGGTYNNPVAAAFDTGSFAPITASHAGVIKAACERVLAAGGDAAAITKAAELMAAAIRELDDDLPVIAP
jgi:hypothetical protein